MSHIKMFDQETNKINQDLLTQYPLPKVDNRVELLSIVFRLSGNFKYLTSYNQFYGVQPDDSLNVIIGLGLGGGNFGPKVKHPDGKEDSYAIVGTWSIDSTNSPFYPVDNYLPILIHEFTIKQFNHEKPVFLLRFIICFINFGLLSELQLPRVL